jgi:hypothetical protein
MVIIKDLPKYAKLKGVDQIVEENADEEKKESDFCRTNRLVSQ